MLLPLALSQTHDDKARVTWTVYGASEQGPARPFWNSFYTAPGVELPEAEALARTLARETGVSMTEAVTRALRDALLRMRGRRTGRSVRDAIIEISERCSALPDLDSRPAEEILSYDDRGGFS